MADRLGIIADIHGISWALEAVLEDLRDKAITRIVNLRTVSTAQG